MYSNSTFLTPSTSNSCLCVFNNRLPRLARYLQAVFIVTNSFGRLNKLETWNYCSKGVLLGAFPYPSCVLIEKVSQRYLRGLLVWARLGRYLPIWLTINFLSVLPSALSLRPSRDPLVFHLYWWGAQGIGFSSWQIRIAQCLALRRYL